MENIKISVANKIPALEGTPSIVCGNSGYTITVAFDEEWAALPNKTARFVYSRGGLLRHQDVAFKGDTVQVPVLSDIREVQVGVFAGDLKTTAPVRIPCKPSILCGSGEVDELDPGAYATVMERLAALEAGQNKADSTLQKFTDIFVSLPGTVHIKTGKELRVYVRNILPREDAKLWIGYNANLTTKYYDEYFTVIAEAEGSHTLPWEVYDAAHNLLASGELQIVAKANDPSGKTTAVVIGDSTVNAGTMTAKLAELYESAGAVLSLLGTRGNGTHEGRGGWTAADYCTLAEKGDITNPFYNGGFDFTYYMQTQGFEGAQAAVIQLGINDIFKFKEHYSWSTYDSAEPVGYMEQIVNSIHSYDRSIKVIINLPTTPNSDGSTFTETYGTTQLYWVYNRNIIRFAEELVRHFSGWDNVVVSASNCILDTKTQIRDGVHPTEAGYNALGQRLFDVMVGNIDGLEAPLLDIMSRTRVTTSVTVAAESPRELDKSKCYDTSFGGVRSSNVSNNITSYTPLSTNSFSCQVSKNTGNGLEFPVELAVGKTYTLSWTSDNANVRAYLMKYNADTSFNSYELLASGSGAKTATITPEEGYVYSVCFPVLVNNVLCTVSDISLTENA